MKIIEIIIFYCVLSLRIRTDRQNTINMNEEVLSVSLFLYIFLLKKGCDLDAIHDTVHKMAKDEARHGNIIKETLTPFNLTISLT